MTKNNKLGKGRFELSKDHERAVRLFSAGQQDEAEALFNSLLRANKADVYAMYHVALILKARRAHAEGLAWTTQGVALAPGFAPIWAVHAVLQQALGQNAAALKSFDRALQLQPDYREVLLNSGVLLREVFQHQAALARFQALLKFEPKHEAALGNAATLLAQMDQPEQAIQMFDRLVQLNPAYPEGLGMLVYERLRSCDWTDLERLTQDILNGVRSGQRVCRSFALMALPSTASDHGQAARLMAAERYPPALQALWQGERYEHPRLRVAYVSPDFREHPVAHLMSGIFRRHDRSRFETIAISLGVDDKSEFRRRLEQSFDRFEDLAGQGSLQVAQRIRELEVDILVDLAGYTADARPEVFAHRPAPVQVNYLGYPGTMGTDYHDVILADRHVIPPEHQAHYSEHVVYLPDAYLPTATDTVVANHTPSRAECGLPETGLVLCAFSHNFKIHPAMFGVWMNLLQQVPGSVLWLAGRPGLMRDKLRCEAQARGVDPARLVFAARVPRVEDHLARYRRADLFLDTAPYNAHTTAADALMAGLPVLTCQGPAFAGRVASSLLHAIGLPELVTSSLQDYEALALQLLSEPARLAALKQQLAANRQTHALFDNERFCRKLEAAFIDMHQAQRQPKDTAAEQASMLEASDAPPAASAPAAPAAVAPRRLHIGGKVRSAGWEVINALPGPNVDHLGNANDLSRFAQHSFEVVYASHVVEHFDYRDELHRTLCEWHRVLKPGGAVEISVPDLAVLAALILDKSLPTIDHFKVMMMMFGGHVDAYDHHKVGLTAELLASFLLNAGFVDVQRVGRFGHFEDTSDMSFAGRAISLNMRARKPS